MSRFLQSKEPPHGLNRICILPQQATLSHKYWQIKKLKGGEKMHLWWSGVNPPAPKHRYLWSIPIIFFLLIAQGIQLIIITIQAAAPPLPLQHSYNSWTLQPILLIKITIKKRKMKPCKQKQQIMHCREKIFGIGSGFHETWTMKHSRGTTGSRKHPGLLII